VGQIWPCGLGGWGQGTDHDVRAIRQVLEVRRHQVTQLPGHTVSNDGATDRASDDEARPCRNCRVRGQGMHHDSARGSPGTRAHDEAELLSSPDPSTPGQHERLGY
jgi:hypothetical protein